MDPFSTHLFAFCNKRQNLIKILVWDNNGFGYTTKDLKVDISNGLKKEVAVLYPLMKDNSDGF